MYAHAQRKHVLQSFDYLLTILIVNSFLVDPGLIRLIFRFIIQIQLSKPREIDATTSLRFFIFCLCFAHSGSVLRHALLRGEALTVGESIVLDFIGKDASPPPSYLAFIDFSIFILQVIMLIIGYETSHHHPDLPDPLAPSDVPIPSLATQSEDDPAAPLNPPPPRPTSTDTGIILHLRLRTTFQRILRPPALAPDTNLPGGATTAPRANDRSITRRVFLQALRNLALAQGQANASLPQSPSITTRNATSATPARPNTNTGNTASRMPGSLPAG